MSKLDLESLAADTARKLHNVWDELGINSDERANFLEQLSSDVAAIYGHRVENQHLRKSNTETEILRLQSMICALQNSMNEPAAYPYSEGYTLLQYRDVLEQKRSTLQQAWDVYYNELRGLECSLFQLYRDVGSSIEESFSAIGDAMSTARINEYKAEISHIEAIKAERASTIASLCQDITELWRELVMSASSDFDHCITTGCAAMGWGLNVIAQLDARRDELRVEKDARVAKVMALGEAITALWKRLMTPVELQTQFLEANSGISHAVVAACEAYLTQLQDEFRSKLVFLIGGARTSISGLWDEARIGGESFRREAFADYFLSQADEGADREALPEGTAIFTDDLYQAHEDYITSLSNVLEARRPLLQDITRRDAMLADKIEYEMIVADPARLLAKGSSSARLREEKLERRVKKELPALSRRLRERIGEWEVSNCAPFLVDGCRWLDSLDHEEAAEVLKHAEERAKRDAHRKDKAGIPSAEVPPVPIAPGMGATASASAGRMSVYRPAILNATAKGLGTTQALPKPLNRKASATNTSMAVPAIAEEGSAEASAAVPSAKAAAAPTVLSNKTKSSVNMRAAVKAAEAPTAEAPSAKLYDTVLDFPAKALQTL